MSSISEDHYLSTVSRRDASLYCALFATLMSLVLILAQELHRQKKLSAVLPEAGLVMLVGVTVSFLVLQHFEDEEEYSNNWVANALLSAFDPEIFYLGFLPPILFNSGYQLKRELFYRHIGPIVLLAGLGTVICALSTALFLHYGLKLIAISRLCNDGDASCFHPSTMELLTFGSLIAATDTVSTLSIFSAKKVDPHIFYVVFGESAINDAVALVLFKTFADYLPLHEEQNDDSSRKELVFGLYKDFFFQASCSPLLGSLFGFGAAFLFRGLDFQADAMYELPLYLLIIYIPFMIAEYLELSGIVSIFFCGLAARRYIEPNLSAATSKSADTIFKVAAYLAETCIFLEMGLSVSSLSDSFNWGFIALVLLSILLGRLAVYPISLFWNFSLAKGVYIPVYMDEDEDVDVESEDEEGDTEEEADDDGKDDNEKTDDQPEGHEEEKKNEEEEACSYDRDISNESSGTSSSQYTDLLSISRTSSTRRSLPAMAYRSERITPWTRKDLEIPSNMMHVIWFAGIRGSVAYACVCEFPTSSQHKDEFIAATMAIVLFTTFVIGGLTPLVLKTLNVPVNVNEEEYMQQWLQSRKLQQGSFEKLELWLYRLAVAQGSSRTLGSNPPWDVAPPPPPPSGDYGLRPLVAPPRDLYLSPETTTATSPSHHCRHRPQISELSEPSFLLATSGGDPYGYGATIPSAADLFDRPEQELDWPPPKRPRPLRQDTPAWKNDPQVD